MQDLRGTILEYNFKEYAYNTRGGRKFLETSTRVELPKGELRELEGDSFKIILFGVVDRSCITSLIAS